MTLLNAADTLHIGGATPSALYLGAVKVWKLPALTMTGTPVLTGSEYEHGIGSTYAGFTVTASGGTPPYAYSLFSGSLPAGITLNSSTGAVSGTPGFESAGVWPNIVIQAIDSVGGIGKLAPFTLTINYVDPYYNNVRLLLDSELAGGDVSFIDKKFGVMGTTGGNAVATIAGSAPPYGTSSILMDGSGDYILFPDDPKWDLLGLPFTIDFTAMPTVLGSNMFWICQFGANTPNLSWVLYSGTSQVLFNVSTTGSDNLNPVATATGALAAGVWARWRLDYDGTAYRLYKNGIMSVKAVATHTKAQVSQPLVIGANSAPNSWWYQGNMKGIRLTVGNARTASDSGYTISNRPFPFVPFVPVAVSFNAATAENVTLTGGNLFVINTASGITSSGARVADVSGKTSGKYYYEVTLVAWVSGGTPAIGAVGTIGSTFVSMQGNATTGVMLVTNGQIWANGSVPAVLTSIPNGGVIGFAIDLDNRKFWCHYATGGNWNANSSADPTVPSTGITIPAGTMVPFCTFGAVSNGPGNKVLTNFGASPFVGAVPTGFERGWPIAGTMFAPTNTTLPTIVGGTMVGFTLSAATGLWIGSSISYTYQWQRNGVNISGATAGTYLVDSADLGATITVVVTATNTGGSASATSAGKGPIVATFNPATLVGLIGWWDTSVTASLNLTGSSINSATDQSGAGNTMNWVNAQPTYNATGFNTTKPAMLFNGSQALQATAFPIGTGNTLTYWAVCTLPQVGGNYGRALSYAKPASNDYDNAGSMSLLNALGSSVTDLRCSRNGIESYANAGATVYPAGHRVIVTVTSAGVMQMYLDGVAQVPGTSGGNWVSGGIMAIGRGAMGSNYWNGPIAECGIATSFNDASTVGNLDNYLKSKWGL